VVSDFPLVVGSSRKLALSFLWHCFYRFPRMVGLAPEEMGLQLQRQVLAQEQET
jgi:hypothetical protein